VGLKIQEKVDPGTVHIDRVNSKWTTDLSVTCHAIKLLKDKQGKRQDLEGVNEFLETPAKTQSMKGKFIHWNSLKLKPFM
jgi:hypothetical protein